MTIQAVFFDMGGTIETYGWTPEMRLEQTVGIQERLEQAGIHLGLSCNQLYETISAGLDKYHQESLLTMVELPPVCVWNGYIFSGYHLDQEKLVPIAEDLMYYIETHYYQRALRPEIPGVLEAIQKMGIKIGLISNVNSRSQVPANLTLYGIRHYFDPIVLSSVYGRRKPDPSIFHHAARLANVPTSACIYVGDRIARDVLGARRAGFQAAIQILHDYNHLESDVGATPDAVISNMSELLDFIRENRDETPLVSMQTKLKGGQIRAILFDAGDILYFRPDGNQHFKSFLNEIGLENKKVHDGEIQNLKEQAFLGLITQDQFQEALVRLYGVQAPEQIEHGKRALQEDDENIQFFNGVRETLVELKKMGYLLGVITDTANPIHVKLRWFDNGGFVHVWDSIISSQEVGMQKPAPQIYAAALQQLGLSANQAVFVGHDDEELKGAHAAGMRTIAFNYDEKASADFYLSDFSDLLSIPIISSK
jgi:putative hydrolase of the HAD superfamily